MSQLAEKPILVGRKPSIPYSALGRKSARGNPTKLDGCPCCGAPVSAARAFVDENTNSLVFGGSHVALEGAEVRIMDALCRRAPGVVTHDSLIMAVWPDNNEPDDAQGNISVRIYSLRRRLILLGLKVVCVYTVGYRLVLP